MQIDAMSTNKEPEPFDNSFLEKVLKPLKIEYKKTAAELYDHDVMRRFLNDVQGRIWQGKSESRNPDPQLQVIFAGRQITYHIKDCRIAIRRISPLPHGQIEIGRT
jgi:hypothetical protein